MRPSVRSVVVCLMLGVATSLSAQRAPANSADDSTRAIVADTTVRTDVATPATPTAGASVTGLRAGVHLRETARPNQPLVAAKSQHLGQDEAMMVVGVAALITGAIIGGTPGTIVMVGGAVVGLIGLYNYLQ